MGRPAWLKVLTAAADVQVAVMKMLVRRSVTSGP